MSGVIKKLLAVIVVLAVIYLIIVTQKDASISGESNKRARQYYENAYFREAAKEFETAFKNGLKDTNSRLLLANCYQYIDKTSEAILTYEKVINDQPKKTYAYYQLGLLHHSEKRFDEAVQWLNRAINIDDDFVPAYILAGLVREKQGNKDEASKYFQAAVSLDNNDIGTKFAKKHLSWTTARFNHLSSKDARLNKINDSAIIPHLTNSGSKTINDWYSKVVVDFFSTKKLAPVYFRISGKGSSFTPYASSIVLPEKNLERQEVFKLHFGFSPAPAYISSIKFRIDQTAPRAFGYWPKMLTSQRSSNTVGIFLKESMSGIDQKSLRNSIRVFSLPFMKKIEGKITYSKKVRALYFIPKKSLKGKSIYIAFVAPKIKDLAGNKLSLFKTWVFIK